MGEAGLFANERVELLDGTVVTMCPQNSPHAATVDRLHRVLTRAVSDATRVRAQLPIILNDWSEPEPDVAVCAPEPCDYAREHPKPPDILLVCEVASSSLAYDRAEKCAAYAESGIAEYWIVDVERRVLHVLGDPDPTARRYRHEHVVGDDGHVRAPGGASIPVAAILPPR